MFTLPHIAGLIVNRPLALHPDKLPVLLDVLNGRIPIDLPEQNRTDAAARVSQLPPAAQATINGPSQRGQNSSAPSRTNAPRSEAPYRLQHGAAVIPVHGSLVNRGAFIGARSGITSYEGLKHQIRYAVADPNVTSIVLDIDSPGGEAVGAFECATVVREARFTKEVVAVVDGMAASAAYAIASGASRIIANPSAVIGSIGVVMLHVDYSKRLASEGIKPTMIFAGSHKVDGNPYQPLSSEVADDLQSEIDSFYSMFLETVAVGRTLSQQTVKSTEARCYIGADAVSARLADHVGDLEQVLSVLAAKAPNLKPASAAGITFTKADVDRARAEGRAEGLEASVTDGGIRAALHRMESITNLPEARGRERLAQSLALSGSVSVDAARQALLTTPTETDLRRAGGTSIGLVFDRVEQS